MAPPTAPKSASPALQSTTTTRRPIVRRHTSPLVPLVPMVPLVPLEAPAPAPVVPLPQASAFTVADSSVTPRESPLPPGIVERGMVRYRVGTSVAGGAGGGKSAVSMLAPARCSELVSARGVTEMTNFLQSFSSSTSSSRRWRVAVIEGPGGCGKSSLARLSLREHGYDVVEYGVLEALDYAEPLVDSIRDMNRRSGALAGARVGLVVDDLDTMLECHRDYARMYRDLQRSEKHLAQHEGTVSLSDRGRRSSSFDKDLISLLAATTLRVPVVIVVSSLRDAAVRGLCENRSVLHIRLFRPFDWLMAKLANRLCDAARRAWPNVRYPSGKAQVQDVVKRAQGNIGVLVNMVVVPEATGDCRSLGFFEQVTMAFARDDTLTLADRERALEALGDNTAALALHENIDVVCVTLDQCVQQTRFLGTMDILSLGLRSEENGDGSSSVVSSMLSRWSVVSGTGIRVASTAADRQGPQLRFPQWFRRDKELKSSMDRHVGSPEGPICSATCASYMRDKGCYTDVVPVELRCKPSQMYLSGCAVGEGDLMV